jgi:hypothetical protein
MTYIDRKFYTEIFQGQEIPAPEFDRIAEAASEVIYAACRVKPTDTDIEKDDFKQAVAYQAEMLYVQGGIDALCGISTASGAIGSESLGDYSVSAGSSKKGVATLDGNIPVSSMALAVLRRLGLMSRWAYSGCFKDWR